MPGPSPAALAPHCRAAAPLQSRPEPGCHSPRARKRELSWTVLRAAAGLRSCSPRRQGWARAGSKRNIGNPASRGAGRGAPRGSQRRRREAGMFRGALSGGGGRGRRRSQRAAGGVRSDSRAPRRGAAAHPALGLRGPAGAKTRRADAAAGSRPLGARPRAPRLGLERLGRCPARAGARARGSEAGCAGGRRAGQDWLGKQPAARSEGRVICETKFTEAQPRFSSAAWSSPLPRLRFYAPSLFF